MAELEAVRAAIEAMKVIELDAEEAPVLGRSTTSRGAALWPVRRLPTGRPNHDRAVYAARAARGCGTQLVDELRYLMQEVASIDRGSSLESRVLGLGRGDETGQDLTLRARHQLPSTRDFVTKRRQCEICPAAEPAHSPGRAWTPLRRSPARPSQRSAESNDRGPPRFG